MQIKLFDLIYDKQCEMQRQLKGQWITKVLLFVYELWFQVQPTIFKAAFDPDAKEREKGVEELLGYLQILENELKHNKFFLGDSFGLVDIPGAFIAYWLPTIIEAGEGKFLSDFNADKFPKIHKWSHEIVSHPVIKEALPPRQLLVGFGKSKFASIAAAST